LGLENANVTLYDITSVMTDKYGAFTFVTDTTGMHSVTEENPAGYISTTPDIIIVNVVNLGRSYYVDFGDTNELQVASIYGTVFDDVNGNGVQDMGELGIEDVTITLDDTYTVSTNNYGIYTYRLETEGTHSIVETDPTGYISTTPNEVHVTVTFGNDYNVDFGDMKNTTTEFASIYGIVFDDLNHNDVYDAGEVGIDNVSVTLDGNTSATTDSYGRYIFKTDTEGYHSVVETDPTGYASITPNVAEINVTLGNGYEVNFADSIDTDGDGISDYRDNCPNVPNADQADIDGDGIGNACDSTDNRPNGGGGGGGGSGGCTLNWSCTDWSACSANGTQTRTCTDKNRCGSIASKPAETQSCTYGLCIENWTCSDWSACSQNGFQTRICIDSNQCTTTKNKPAETQSCSYTGAVCGNGVCETGEDSTNCLDDCPAKKPLGITGFFAFLANPLYASLIALLMILIGLAIWKRKQIILFFKKRFKKK